MSEDNEYDNEWGSKKQKYYSMNKRENNSSESDSDFIEDEKEAIRLQKIRAQKIKKAKILNEEEDEISEKEKNKNKKEENEINKDISFKTVEIDNTKILENINSLKYSLEEIQTAEDEIKIFEENKLNSNLPNTLEYLKQYKRINILNAANILFNIISTLNQKEEEGEEIEDDYLNDNKEDENEEEMEEEENNELEEEEEDEQINTKKNNNKKIINNKISNNPEQIKQLPEKIKKPSFLSKKKHREISKDKEIDKKLNENFDNNSSEDEDSFIQEQYKSFNKLNKEKELLDLKKEENEKKEIEMKNDFAIRKANKEVLKARGIYRKRKKYQGNAKLMNREKFYKKEKERRRYVKDYVGKPDVYMGEATGIRRDLIRSTKIH